MSGEPRLERRERHVWAPFDAPAPEFDGRTDLYRVDRSDGEYVVAVSHADVFCAYGASVVADPAWRDRYGWAEDDRDVENLYGCLVDMVRGMPLPERAFRLPLPAMRDLLGMVSRLRDEFPGGIPVDYFEQQTTASLDSLAARIAVSMLCDEFTPTGDWPERCEEAFDVQLRWDFGKMPER